MIVTEKYLESLKDGRGRFKKGIVNCLGIEYPPKNDWKTRVIGSEINDNHVCLIAELKLSNVKPLVAIKRKPNVVTKKKKNKKAKKRTKTDVQRYAARKNNPKHFNLERMRYQAMKLKENQIKLNSKLEQKFAKILTDNDVRFDWQHPLFTSTRYVCVDFYFSDTKTIVEVDGPCHNSKEQIASDENRTAWILENFDVKELIRISYLDFKNENIEHLILDKLD